MRPTTTVRLLLGLLAASPPAAAQDAPDRFARSGYSGEAELTSYRLEQARYGEVHPGHDLADVPLREALGLPLTEGR